MDDRRMAKLKIAMGVCAALVAVLVVVHVLFVKDNKRIVIRDDGQYEVELWYGPLGWQEMGGPYATIEEARAQVEHWRRYDEEQARDRAIRRQVVE